MGARLLGAFPFTPLAANHSYGVGVTSMDGWLNYGFVADYDAIPDLEVVPDMVVAAMAELTASAEALVDRGRRGPRPRAVSAEAPVSEATGPGRQGGASKA